MISTGEVFSEYSNMTLHDLEQYNIWMNITQDLGNEGSWKQAGWALEAVVGSLFSFGGKCPRPVRVLVQDGGRRGLPMPASIMWKVKMLSKMKSENISKMHK